MATKQDCHDKIAAKQDRHDKIAAKCTKQDRRDDKIAAKCSGQHVEIAIQIMETETRKYQKQDLSRAIKALTIQMRVYPEQKKLARQCRRLQREKDALSAAAIEAALKNDRYAHKYALPHQIARQAMKTKAMQARIANDI